MDESPTSPVGNQGTRRNSKVKLLRRPKGIRPPDMPIPKGVDRRKVVAILTGSNYQVATRVWMQDGHLLATRAIIDTGSGMSLIREDLHPKEVKVCPLDKSTPNMFDVNGNILPITGLLLCMCASVRMRQRTRWASFKACRCPYSWVPHTRMLMSQ